MVRLRFICSYLPCTRTKYTAIGSLFTVCVSHSKQRYLGTWQNVERGGSAGQIAIGQFWSRDWSAFFSLFSSSLYTTISNPNPNANTKGVGKMRECGTEYVQNAGVKNAGMCCGSTGKMREPIHVECGTSVSNRRTNPHHGAYSDGKFCNRPLLQYLSQLEYK